MKLPEKKFWAIVFVGLVALGLMAVIGDAGSSAAVSQPMPWKVLFNRIFLVVNAVLAAKYLIESCRPAQTGRET